MSDLLALQNEAIALIKATKSVKELDDIRVLFLGKKGKVTQHMKMLGKVSPEERPKIGQEINAVKKAIQAVLTEHILQLENTLLNEKLSSEVIDVTLPSHQEKVGTLHPVSQTIQRIESFFVSMGFDVEVGPEIEDAFHNFSALNIPEHHPARTDHDTFFFNPNLMLRTHTSGVQIRTMEKKQPPLKIICPGRVYRNDYDKTHTPMFHQIEGLFVASGVNFAQLKGVMHDFLRHFFDADVEIRFRPSYFPFTEPSAEVDVKNKNGEWLEVLGCGMVHPKVFEAVGIDSTKYSGFAFGLGVERLTMLRLNIKDLRAFFENDMRFLKQF